MIVNQDNRVDIEKQPQEVDLLKAVFLLNDRFSF